jgi:hypothetical protein
MRYVKRMRHYTMVGRILIALAFTFAATSVQARPDARTMTCAQAQALVKKNSGGITISTGTHTYQRFVSNPNSCSSDQRAGRASAPTKDNKRCRVGYVCRHMDSGR